MIAQLKLDLRLLKVGGRDADRFLRRLRKYYLALRDEMINFPDAETTKEAQEVMEEYLAGSGSVNQEWARGVLAMYDLACGKVHVQTGQTLTDAIAQGKRIYYADYQ